jgi:hypothetical protein
MTVVAGIRFGLAAKAPQEIDIVARKRKIMSLLKFFISFISRIPVQLDRNAQRYGLRAAPPERSVGCSPSGGTGETLYHYCVTSGTTYLIPSGAASGLVYLFPTFHDFPFWLSWPCSLQR